MVQGWIKLLYIFFSTVLLKHKNPEGASHALLGTWFSNDRYGQKVHFGLLSGLQSLPGR